MVNSNNHLTLPIHLTYPRNTNIFAGGKNWTWNVKLNDYYNLWYPLKGEGIISINSENYPIRPGSAFILRPNDVISAYCYKEKPIVNFASHWKFKDPTQMITPYYNITLSDPLFFNSIIERCMQAKLMEGEQNAYLIENYVLMLISIIIRDGTQSDTPNWDDKIMLLVEKITENPRKDWSVDKMSALAAISRAQLNRRFRRVTQMSPIEFVVKTRLDNAMILLKDSQLSMEEIAESTGYKDLYFFSRQFKKKIGISPLQFRKKSSQSKQ
jgi:AraC-like DNA-binding protein